MHAGTICGTARRFFEDSRRGEDEFAVGAARALDVRGAEGALRATVRDFAAAARAGAGAVAVDVHEAVEHDELERELDSVRKGLGGGFVDPVAAVDLDDEDDVEDDAKGVDVDEVFLRVARVGRVAGLEHLVRAADVDDGDDKFLQGEDDELDTFVDVINGEPDARILLVAAKGQDGRRHLEDEEVGDDDDQNQAQESLVSDDQMEARIQHQALPGHHPPPAKGGKGRVDGPWTAPYEPFQDDAQRVTHDPP